MVVEALAPAPPDPAFAALDEEVDVDALAAGPVVTGSHPVCPPAAVDEEVLVVV